MTAAAVQPRVFIGAGEVSGDIVAAKLIGELRAANPSTIVDGIGGTRMAEAGATLVASANHIGAIGVSEGLAVAPSALRVFHAVKRHVRAHRPHVAVLIGNDVFSVVLGRSLRAMGITTIALFPPQIWIWQAVSRVTARSFDLVLASFPDEARCYRDAGVETEFVGHYLADVLAPAGENERSAARRALGLSPSDPVVALLPGSRPPEITRLLPIMLDAADLIRATLPAAQLVAALTTAGAASREKTLRTPNGHRVLVANDSHTVMQSADVLVCCSGTATLEAALLGVPMVVAYKMSRTTHLIVRTCIRMGLIASDTVALPNLVLGRSAVPEFVQRDASAADIANAALALVPDAAPRREMRLALEEVRAHLARAGTLARVAQVVLERARP